MPDRTITTPEGTTVSLADGNGDLVVLIDHPGAPADMRPTEAGRIVDGGFQPAVFASWAVRPSVLRAIADLMEEVGGAATNRNRVGYITGYREAAGTWLIEYDGMPFPTREAARADVADAAEHCLPGLACRTLTVYDEDITNA